MDGRLPCCCSLYAGGIMRRGSGGTVFIFHIIIDGSGSDDPSALVGRSVGRSVRRSVGRSHGRSVGLRSVGRSVGVHSRSTSVDQSVLVGQSVNRSVGEPVNRSVSLSVGQSASVGRRRSAVGARSQHGPPGIWRV